MQPITLALLLSLVLFQASSVFGCGVDDKACLQKVAKARSEYLQKEILNQIPDADYNGAVLKKFDNASRQLYIDWLAEYEEANPNIAKDPDVQISFIPAVDPSAGEDRSELIGQFELKDELEETVLVDANLLFATDVPANLRHATQEVSVQVYEKNENNQLGELVATKTFMMKGSQSVRMELPIEAVNRWFSNNKKSAGIFVSAIMKGHNIAVHPQQNNKDSDMMVLQLATKANGPVAIPSQSRQRRSLATPVCTKQNPSKGCCLYDMVVSFDEIGWDWIIAPPRYNAYMCKGNCKLNSHHFMNDFAHSKVMRSARENLDEVRDVEIGYCCHPVEYDFVRMIYVNRNGRVSVANVNGMIARRCGCS